MEIDRVQLVKGLKVERTGSEQERQRRQQSDESFEDLLESTLEGEGQAEQQPGDGREAAANRDTVSIASGEPLSPLVNDLVSISTAARVSAEVHNAGRRDGDPQQIESELRRHKLPESREPQEPEKELEEPASREGRPRGRGVDTLA